MKRVGSWAGVQIPALVDGPLQRTPDQPVVQSPGRLDLVVGADREDVGGSVGQVHPGARDGGLHDVLGVVGDRVLHRLVLRGHLQGGAVVVRAVVQRGDPPGAGVDGGGDRSRAVGAQDQRRCLHLDLEAEASGRQPGGGLVRLAGGDHRLHLTDRADLRERDHQAVRESARTLQERAQEEIQGAQATTPGRRLEALETQSDEGRGGPGGQLRRRDVPPPPPRRRPRPRRPADRSRPRSPAAGPRSVRRPAWPRRGRRPPRPGGRRPRPNGRAPSSRPGRPPGRPPRRPSAAAGRRCSDRPARTRCAPAGAARPRPGRPGPRKASVSARRASRSASTRSSRRGPPDAVSTLT